MSITYITYDEWFDKYQPVINTNSGEGDYRFETYGADLAVVSETDYHYVWTVMDGDEDVVVSGRAFVNRMNYYITTKPWSDNEDIEVHDPDYTEFREEECEVCNNFNEERGKLPYAKA